MAAKAGNNCISTASVEIPTENSGFSTITSSNSVAKMPSECDNEGQPK